MDAQDGFEPLRFRALRSQRPVAGPTSSLGNETVYTVYSACFVCLVLPYGLNIQNMHSMSR